VDNLHMRDLNVKLRALIAVRAECHASVTDR
jgi:hypothetical protein